MWRCIDTGYNNGFYNMALDEVLLEMVAKGESLPVLRFYGWNPPCISLGYFQKANSSIDIDFCKKNSIDIVRRITGGRTVFHHKELTYSIIIPESSEFVKGSITEAYKKISIGLLEGLKLCGINAEFSKGTALSSSTSACFEASSRYEIVIGNKKLVGSAQTRKRGVVLQHGSIIMSFDEDIFGSCLGLFGQKKDKFIIEFMSKAANLERDGGKFISRELLIKEIINGFTKFANVQILEDTITKVEEKSIVDISGRYNSDTWNFSK